MKREGNCPGGGMSGGICPGVNVRIPRRAGTVLGATSGSVCPSAGSVRQNGPINFIPPAPDFKLDFRPRQYRAGRVALATAFQGGQS